jgi:NAD-dependent dihydropyrimidine dehydrogenase PreA subunit
LPNFENLWSDCTQEESKLISKTQNNNEVENQSLDAQVKKRNKREEGMLAKSKRPRYKKDALKIRFYSCQKLGQCSFQCPDRNEKEKKKHHAHETDDEEHSKASKDE